MRLNGGTIVIGSLLWDNMDRKKWRDENLLENEKIQIYLPIRYGRLSKGKRRKDTYTMVFSNICYKKNYGMGTGWILPFKNEIKSFEELKEQAINMGKAEGFSNGLATDWGSVALLLNSKKNIPKSITNKWSKLLNKNLNNGLVLYEKLESEKTSIDSNGFLKIKWPKEVSSSFVDNFDFLIATVTEPVLIKKRYPTVFRIADSMKKANYYEYFRKNKKCGITTFQDEKISSILDRDK